MNSAMSPSTQLNLRFLRSCRLFAGCDDALLESLAHVCHRSVHKRGDMVFRAGEVGDNFCLISRGLVKIVRADEAGAESILAVFGPRESFGDAAVYGRTAYPGSACAASDTTEIVHVPAAPVLEAAAREPRVAHAMSEALLAHTHALQAKISIMTAGSVPRRLAMLFSHLNERFGDELEDGGVLIPLALSRGELAELVGARVETVIRTLSKWQKAGHLDARGEGFRIPSLEALNHLVYDDD